MKKYSIVRIGSEYVVQAGETSILKVSSRREAAKLVTDAAELLEQEPASRPRIEQPSIPDRPVKPDRRRSSLTIGRDSLNHRGGTPPPNGRLTIWKDRS